MMKKNFRFPLTHFCASTGFGGDVPRPAWQLLGAAVCLALTLAVGAAPRSQAATAEHGAVGAPAASKASESKPAASAPTTLTTASENLGADLKKSIKEGMVDKKKLTLMITEKPDPHPAATKTNSHSTPAPAAAHGVAPNPRTSRDSLKAKAAALTGHEAPAGNVPGGNAHAGEPHWSYEGDTGPQNWGKLKPEFSTCATGKRQSPINIEESATLHGPAEPLLFNYTPSTGSVVNNDHSIQVDVQGNNTLAVRGSVYKLVQLHFHTPSEEQLNYRHSAMVTHLVHKNAEGQLAVVAVLMDPGTANPVINTVWTYMPLDINDRVRLPADSIDLNDLLPKDPRYYQFMGSLTTPPCTEGVLWLVFKQTVQVSKDQIHLFQQLYPGNARPVQPVNNRAIRNAQ